jgi:translation initiation factor IF-2
MRIYEAAKQFKLTNEELIELLAKAGISVKSHMSVMTPEMTAAVEAARGKTTAKAPASEAPPKAKPAPKATPAKPSKAAAKPVEAAQTTHAATADKAAGGMKTAEKPNKQLVAKKPPALDRAASVRESAREAVRKAVAKSPTAAKPVKEPIEPHPKVPPAKRVGPAGPKDVSRIDAQQKAVRESVRRTLAKIEATRRTRRRKTKTNDATAVIELPVRVAEGITVEALATAFEIDAAEIVRRGEDLGLVAVKNQPLNREAIELLADDFDKNIHVVADDVEDLIETDARVEPARLKPRAPIVTVMGHVDHGKTSILDFIRKARVAAGEAGGITQHIGAYQVRIPGGEITFIDTPGHEAFTSMRARGAKVTDIVVLVVAADDGVMPQTLEAISHAKAARVPVIVAINKTDLPNINTRRIRQQLAERDVVVEEFGGDAVSVEVSAKTGAGIDKLLEMILLQTELMELKADADAPAQAVAVEVRKEEGRGILCTVLVVQGTLRVGDVFVIGSNYGKVKALLDFTGRVIKSAGPSTPVQVSGCNGLPEPGDRLVVVRDERDARELSMARQQKMKDRDRVSVKKLTLEELYSQIQSGKVKELRLIVKGDTNGSVEAVTQSLGRLSIDEVGVKILHAGVGVVNESDILLAASSGAVVIGFNVKVSPKAQEVAQRESVEVKYYEIIYEAINDVDAAMKGLLEPVKVERVTGRAEVRRVFKISKLGQIAGSFVTEGTITRNGMVRVIRAGDVIFEGRIASLKRFRDDAREVQKDFECGIGVAGFGDLQDGDIIEAFVVEEKARAF